VVRIFSATYPCGDQTKEVFTFRHLPYPQTDDLKIQEDIKRDGQGEDSSMKKFDKVIFTVQ
jgi:hypothetical protein